MDYFVTQYKGGLGQEPIIITKKLNDKELQDLGFFPLSEYEQRYFDKNGIITIVGDQKHTIIKRR